MGKVVQSTHLLHSQSYYQCLILVFCYILIDGPILIKKLLVYSDFLNFYLMSFFSAKIPLVMSFFSAKIPLVTLYT
jgi:hypothetical protein